MAKLSELRGHEGVRVSNLEALSPKPEGLVLKMATN